MESIKVKSTRNPLFIRLSEEERERLTLIADAWGVKLVIAIRRLIREAKIERMEHGRDD